MTLPDFEVGPIRPPSEARSLLVRVTRNCPHNRCAFCPVYRGTRFSIRAVDDVLADVDAMGRVALDLQQLSRELGCEGAVTLQVLHAAASSDLLDGGGLQVAYFLAAGGQNAFLQDANSLVMRPEQLVLVLDRMGQTFPTLQRVTSYARSHTLTRRSVEQLSALRQRGLNRIHVGLESGSDAVLELVHKGVSAARHVEAGRRVKAAGMELSEYVMPGRGGRKLSREHAVESARVLSEIDPHFIRLRTTAHAPGTELAGMAARGEIEPLDDEEVVAEIRLFLENLQVTSLLKSDHVLNLLAELEGKLPGDRGRLLGIIDRFQEMEPRLRRAFVLARRAGLVTLLDEMQRPAVQERALQLLEALERKHGDDIGAAVRELMTRFV